MLANLRVWILTLALCFALGPLAPAQTPTEPKPTAEVQALVERAMVLVRQFKWAEGLAILEEAAQKAKAANDYAGLSLAYLRSGTAEYGRGRLEPARAFFEQALQAAIQSGSKYTEMGIRGNIAVTLDNLGRRDEARPVYVKILDYAREVKDARMEANMLINLAILESRSERPSQALPWALAAAKAYADLKDEQWGASAMGQVGDAYRKLWQPKEAEVALQEALRLANSSKSIPAQAVANSSLGVHYRAFGDPARALAYTKKGLELRRQTGDERFTVVMQSELAIIYELLGQRESALFHVGQAVATARKNANPVQRVPSLTNYGTLLLLSNRLTEARRAIEEALGIARSIDDGTNVAYQLGTLAAILRRQGKTAEAQTAVREAEQIFAKLGDLVGQANAVDLLASLHMDRKEYPVAIEQYQKAIALFEQAGNSRLAAISRARLGKAYLAAGRPREAEANLRQFVTGIEAVRLRLGATDEGQAEFLASHISFYQDLVALLVRQGRTKEAFELLQQMKGRTMVARLSAGRVSIQGRMTPEERDREAELRSKADRLNAAMVREGALNEEGAKRRFLALKAELQVAEAEMAAFTTDIVARYPDLAASRSLQTATLAQVGAALPPDTALLEYCGGEDPLVFVVSKTEGKVSVAAFPLGLKGINLRSSIASFGRLVSNPAANPAPLSRSLYQALIQPAVSAIRGKTKLILCPDGELWDVPFAALGLPNPLSERFDLAFAYSGTAVQRTARMPVRGPAPAELLIVANPDFGGAARFGDNPLIPGQRPIETPSRPIETPSRPIETPSRPIETPSRPIETPSRPIETPSRPIEPPSRDFGGALRAGIVQLPGTQLEAEKIAALFPRAIMVTGIAAQESLVRQDAGRFSILHLASHAFFNDAAPMLSSIVLATPSDPDQDGYLTAREIFDLNLQADLVVLSACNTARGGRRSGEGLVGLSWALTSAGARSQVVSQWAVDDRATAELMTRFYANLKAGLPKDTALRRAAVSLRDPKRKDNDPKWRHPYYWAPFIFLGDSRPQRP